MKYYGYKRVSTPTQEKSGYGLDTQDAAIKDYCEKNNIELSGIFEDAGISGTNADRHGLNELLEVLQKDDVVIVLNTSRLWRSDSVKVLIHHELKKDNVQIKSIEQPSYNIYTKDPSDFLFNGMLELLDQYERMTISKKLARGRKTKAHQGSKPSGTAPFGYRWQAKEVVFDYNNNLIALDICQTFHDTGRSLARTKEHCDRMGYRTNTGKPFSKQSIKNIVTNDFYIGVVTHAGVKIQGNHLAIEPIELFKYNNPGYTMPEFTE